MELEISTRNVLKTLLARFQLADFLDFLSMVVGSLKILAAWAMTESQDFRIYKSEGANLGRDTSIP